MLPRILILPILALAATSCTAEPTCLSWGDCNDVTPCAALTYSCGDETLSVGPLASAGAIDLGHAEGVGGDLLLQNDHITAVIDRLESPHDLAPTGGNLLDFGPRGGEDGINLIYQIAGILPDDAFAYTSLEIVDRAPVLVAVIVRGALDGRPEVEVATRYELRPCEPGLRVRSELRNRSPDIQVFLVADAAHWGKRRVLPFTPLAGEGYLQPDLDLIELEASWESFEYVAARAPHAASASYGFVACDRDRLEGVNDPEISALGTARVMVRPGESLVLERFLSTAAGPDLTAEVAALAAQRAMLHGDPPAIAVRGQVRADGVGFGGDSRRTSLILQAGDGVSARPLTAVVPGADGNFSAEVPATGALSYELWSFGRPVVSGSVAGGDDLDLGVLEIDPPAIATLTVADGDGAAMDALVVFHPADPATRAAVTGSFHGRFGDCAPWLGPPHGRSPACNRVLVPPAGVDVEVPAGRYQIYATAGPDWSLARAEVELRSGEVTAVDLGLQPLAVRPPGWLAADLHVHGGASFDAAIPDGDRVRSFVALGVDVIAATDHDYVRDYDDAVLAAGLDGRIAVVSGVEATQLIPFLAVPDDDFPRVTGHFNFWPLTADREAPRGGAPWDERLEPGQLLDLFSPLIGEDGIAMMNHPWVEALFGRDQGYLHAVGYDPRVAIPDHDDGSRAGMLARRPGGGHGNLDFDLFEVQNGGSAIAALGARPLWFSLLSQGFVMAGAANSDSHGLNDSQLGYGRNLVDVGATTVADFDLGDFDAALRDGRAIGGNGVVVLVTVGAPGGVRRGLGFTPYVPRPGDTVDLEVRAPPWIPVTEVRVVSAAGIAVVAAGGELDAPADPLGTAGVVRWQASLPLADLVVSGRDDWLVVEAGMPYFLTADLDDDGLPDTSDNNRDGRVDADDVEEDEETGPLESPPDPDDESDPRYFFTRVVPEAWPAGFTNPIFIDWAGDGWQPPGIEGAR